MHYARSLLTQSCNSLLTQCCNFRLENDVEGRKRHGAQWQTVDSSVAASVQREELVYLRGKLASMASADADTLLQLQEFEGSPSAAQLQQPISSIETQAKSLTLQRSEGSASPEHLALKAASDAIEQCVNTRASALEELKGTRWAAAFAFAWSLFDILRQAPSSRSTWTPSWAEAKLRRKLRGARVRATSKR